MGIYFSPDQKAQKLLKYAGCVPCHFRVTLTGSHLYLAAAHSLTLGAGVPLCLSGYSEASSFLFLATPYQPNLLSKFARVVITKYNRLHSLNNRYVFFHSLEAAISRSSQQSWSLLRPLFLACRCPPSPSVLPWSVLCADICLVSVSSPHKDTSKIGLGPTPMNSF